VTLTNAAFVLLVNTRASYQNIVHHREYALTGDPVAISSLDPGIMDHSGFILHDATTVNASSKGNLIGVKVIKARFPNDLVLFVTEDVDD
jgi:hypothetical protein